MTMGDTARYRKSYSLGLDGLKSSGDVRYAFNASNTL